jgi:hypothetical protein
MTVYKQVFRAIRRVNAEMVPEDSATVSTSIIRGWCDGKPDFYDEEFIRHN